MAAAATNAPSQIISVSDREWQPMLTNIKAKTLWSDPASKRRAQLTRFEPGAVLPMHRHAGDELLYVIEGSITDESGTTAAGSVGYRHQQKRRNRLRHHHRQRRTSDRNWLGAALPDHRLERNSLERCDAGGAPEANLA
jgi:anti-sigma factor ChrR (cupin superfamily)